MKTYTTQKSMNIFCKSQSNKVIIDTIKDCRRPILKLVGLDDKRAYEVISILKVIPVNVETVELFPTNWKNNISMLDFINLNSIIMLAFRNLNDFELVIKSIPHTVSGLSLIGNSLHDKHAKIISNVGRFKRLDLSYNNITSVGVRALLTNQHILQLKINEQTFDLDSPIERERYKKRYNMLYRVPSLKQFTSFFISKWVESYDLSNIPSDTRELINSHQL
jgi:hypothetical protein